MQVSGGGSRVITAVLSSKAAGTRCVKVKKAHEEGVKEGTQVEAQEAKLNSAVTDYVWARVRVVIGDAERAGCEV